jgi:hypothetical protein
MSKSYEKPIWRILKKGNSFPLRGEGKGWG